MINLKQNPTEWARLMYELDDLKDHLSTLIDEMNSSGEISIEEYQVQVGHLYAHLNRAWNSRDATAEVVEKNLKNFTEFPKDITTCG
ncbi:hypothetical protein [Arenicella xantha]|uniref:Uncharacterized protein n=1 Tax=Arenicella xantha TaxID=644221 RepID=A0A395JEA2_9GAMM|nr:hypothetical protein [Arenicella xantha]RBP47007.1 hypothetical protein DFR28_1131 [Arenicella xantha]